MVMRSMRRGASGGVLKYLLFGLLGMSVGGLVLMDVRGVLNGGGVGGNDVARIADDAISIQEFDRVLRRSLAQYREITPQQAFKIGLADEILAGEIRTYILLNEARHMGIELGKPYLARRVADTLKPYAQPDQKLQDTLEMMLRYQGISEAAFVEAMRREASGTLIMNALHDAFPAESTEIAHDLYQFQEQKRDIEIVLFPDEAIQSITPATDEQLSRLYDSLKTTRYKVPEYRTVKLLILDPAKVDAGASPSESTLKDYYDDHTDDFYRDEQLVLTQILLNDAEQAQSVYDAVQSGTSLKDAAKPLSESGATHVENRPFETDALLPEILDAVEAIDVGGVTPPVHTALGYHIVRLEQVIPPETQPFDSVRDTVAAALLQEQQHEEIYRMSEALDNPQTQATAIEEMTNRAQAQITDIGPFERTGLAQDGTTVFDDLSASDKRFMLDTAFELEQGDASALEELSDGRLAALILSDITEEYFTPFEDVKEEIAAQYIKNQQRAENESALRTRLAELGTGGTTLTQIAQEAGRDVQTMDGIALSGTLPAPLKNSIRPVLAQIPIGGHDLLALDSQFALVRVTDVHFPDMTQAPKDDIAPIEQAIDREFQDSMFLMYLRATGKKYDTQVNRLLLERVYGEQPE